ncbi:ABC transporter [Lentithecium fluviatile CBS 122367]|uniref:ABC transporter n=1 Tax=Lentithecium fluviatile CBS 122367 TaxID=1168545 RepID=A0A6G1JEW3_9PLEO|nr:ABC transporter [Lentithecium fluviatile CBS 122367]
MALLWRQIRTLAHKNLIITLYRHWLSTPLRAFVLPILIVLLLSFIRNFLFPDALYGIGTSRPIRSLQQVVAVAGGRDRIVFVNGGFIGGDIERVIADAASQVRNTSLDVITVQQEEDLRTTCVSTIRGTSRCIAAAVFHSSPTEGDGGAWNYTIRADGALGAGGVHVDADMNDAQIYTLPLQHTVDFAIGLSNPAVGPSALEQVVYEYPFTSQTQNQLEDSIRRRYMSMVARALAAPFYLAIACVLYQMTGLMATEREIGMAKLLDTMMPNRSRWQPQIARLLSHHAAFDILYAPGWILSGALLGALAFQKTSMVVPILFNLLAGLSATSLSIFAGAFFRKAQLSGITAIIIGLLFALLGQLTAKSGTGLVVVLALIFPPMNYVYFLVAMARFESQNRALDLLSSPPESSFSIPAIVFLLFAVCHTLVYFVFGALVERALHGVASASHRTVASGPSPIAVNMNGLTKVYQPGFAERVLQFWTKKPLESVIAVNSLDLQAHQGEILVLLGANGSGKSTTLDAVAGMSTITSGEVTINYPSPRSSFGYCPQRNILWDDLTVIEHVEIFDSIKAVDRRATKADNDALIESCDLAKKKTSLSKSLSGGQKRKLQIAAMFAGDSLVCCVDEVSSGVDPLSRRKLWDILLSQHGRRSIILTTHFLDEADLLADRVAILSKGSLKAFGTSVELKNTLGSGYRVHVNRLPSLNAGEPYSDILHSENGHEIVYFPGTSTETYHLMRRLDQDRIDNYQVRGPTLEDVFFKVEEEAMAELSGSKDQHFQRSSSDSGQPLVLSQAPKTSLLGNLQDGRVVSIPRQIAILISKRFTLLRRNPLPYLILLSIPIIAAGCSTLFLKKVPYSSCNPAEQISSTSSAQPEANYRLVAGPRTQLSEAAMQRITQAPPGSVTVVETLDEFHSAVQQKFGELMPGGFFLGDKPTMAWQADGPPIFAHIVQNLVSNLVLNMTINNNYEALEIPFQSKTGDLLLFIILFGLSMAVYPAFLALYPTLERLRGVRAMHYSNGVRAIPLWLSYLIFDFGFVLATSLVAVIIFGATVNILYATPYLFLIFILYGIASTLYSYVISLFSTSQLAAFAVTAASQTVTFLVYFVVFMVVFTFADSSDQTSPVDITYYSLALTSPAFSLARAVFITSNVFGVACRDRRLGSYPGAIDLYGGPILYLVLQSVAMFIFLVFKDSGSRWGQWWNRRAAAREKSDGFELEAATNFSHASNKKDGLRVVGLQKRFKKETAVDNVSFGIQRSTCFALVGPNGAGKSTTISMIRGDLQPSSWRSDIFVNGVSMIRHRNQARADLGVCPQIDPLDNMTVVEHLRFYALIRGIGDPLHNIHALMEAVGIQQFASRIATKLSGGNKRKLSLAIALMGNPSVLILDEPSSGMDAVSKRIMWRTLAAVTPGRSLLLTTHSMEEADALASSVGVVATRMLASGTIDELRRRYGGAYYVQIVHRDAPHTRTMEMKLIEHWIKHDLPGAKIDGLVRFGQVRVQIPLRIDDMDISLADIFERLEASKASLGVGNYSVSVANLDQIFLSVVE